MSAKLNIPLIVLLAAGLAACARYHPRPISLEERAMAFDSRTLTSPQLQEFAAQFGYGAERQWPPRAWSRDDLLLVALFYHPSLDPARAQWRLGHAGLKTVAGLPNPTVVLSPGYDFSAVAPASPWIPGVSIDMPIETAGKRRIRKAEAAFLAEADRLSIASAAAIIRSNLQAALIEFHSAEERVKLLNEEQQTQASISTLLEQRREAGAISASEAAPFRIALLRVQSEKSRAESVRIESRDHLAEALGLPRSAIEGITLASLPESGKKASELLSNASSHRKRALQGRSDLIAALARYEASQLALQLEIAKQYPDIRLGSGYQWDQGEDKWNLSIGVDLPVFNQNQGPIAEAEAKRSRLAAELLELQSQIISQVDRGISLCNSLLGEAAQARQTLDALNKELQFTKARFEAGGADQVEVLSIEVEAISARIALLDAEMRLRSAEAELEAAFEIPFSTQIARASVVERNEE